MAAMVDVKDVPWVAAAAGWIYVPSVAVVVWNDVL